MNGSVVYFPHVLTPHKRTVAEVNGYSLADLDPQWPRPYLALVDGHAVLRADWPTVIITEGRICVFIDCEAIPQGGGGSDPLRTVAMLAVIVIATVYGGPLGGYAAESLFGAATVGAYGAGVAIGTMAVMVAGTMLVNAILPPETQSISNNADMQAASPTYTLGAQGNSARIEGAITEHFGRHLAYPDFAAMPYQEFFGNDQLLYQVFCLGRGEYDIETIRIGDTSIDSYSNVVIEVVPPYGSLTLVPAQVLTSSEVTDVEMEVETFTIAYIANPEETETTAIGVDFIAPRGMYYAMDDGAMSNVVIGVDVYARAVNDYGAPIGDFFLLGHEVMNGATVTPQRFSFQYNVSPGRYDVRVMRTTSKNTEARCGNDIKWIGLRAYIPTSNTFGDCTLIAVRMQADGQLSAMSSRKINVVATRKLPIWNGSSWSAPTATRSIAWALAYVCKEMGATDAQIDLATLLSLDATWSARGDECNGRVDNFMAAWDALGKIAAAGRAKPYMQGGIVRFYRDEPATIPVALYSQRSIVKGSFGIDYLMPSESTADAISVGYFDATPWAQRRVTASLPDSTAEKPAKTELSFVTGRLQAYREGMWQAACNRYRRQIITLTTEMEGFVPSYGDLAVVQHDMPAWGQSGEVVASESAGNLLINSSDFTASGWGFIGTGARTAGAEVAPDGTTTAWMVDDTDATLARAYLYQNITIADDAAVYSGGFHLKAGTAANTRIAIAMTGGTTINCVVNVAWGTTPAITVVSGTATCALQTLDDGWYFASITCANNASGNTLISLRLFPAGQAASITGTVYAWGAQLNEGSSPGMYVPTTTSARSTIAITPSEEITWSTGATHYIGLRRLNGSMDGPIEVDATLDGRLLLADLPDFTPYTGGAYERTHYSFGWAQTWGKLVRILSAKPKSMTLVEISAVNEEDAVHTADIGVFPPPAIVSQLPKFTAYPPVVDLRIVADQLDAYLATLSWQPSPWSEKYVVQQSFNASDWTDQGTTTAITLPVALPYGPDTFYRVAAVGNGGTMGPWSQVQADLAVFTEALPDVTGLLVYWRGNQAVLRWTAVTDPPKPISYEIRKGSSWINGQRVGTTTDVEWISDGDGTYWVAASFSRAYSANPVSTVLAGSMLAKNVVASWDEAATGWAGTVGGSAALLGGVITLAGVSLWDDITDLDAALNIDYLGIGSAGSYELPASHEVDLGTVQACTCSVDYTARADNPFALFDDIADIDSVPSMDGDYSGLAGVTIQIAISDLAGTYGAWQDFYPGSYVGRKFKFRANLASTDTNVIAVLDSLVVTVDMPDRNDKGTAVSVPSGGSTITYAAPFQVAPNVQVSLVSATAGDDVVISSADEDGFTVRVYNGGSGVARTLNWIAQGY